MVTERRNGILCLLPSRVLYDATARNQKLLQKVSKADSQGKRTLIMYESRSHLKPVPKSLALPLQHHQACCNLGPPGLARPLLQFVDCPIDEGDLVGDELGDARRHRVGHAHSNRLCLHLYQDVVDGLEVRLCAAYDDEVTARRHADEDRHECQEDGEIVVARHCVVEVGGE
jgi:hypothetical protein